MTAAGPAVGKVLIVGGGTTGCALAILLARGGVQVEIAEIRPDWNVQGSGITLQGNALKVLRELGVWEEVRASGFGFDGVGIRTPDGTLVHQAEDMRTGGPDLPATLGMPRPRLQEILTAAVTAAGVRPRLGVTVAELSPAGDGVDATLTDGHRDRYDLVVGADGVRSRVRGMIGIDVGPEPVGMGIWRVLAKRPAEVTRTDLIYGGPCHIAGYCPISDEQLYAYLVEDARPRESVDPAARADVMREMAGAYGGPWEEIAADINDPARVNHTWFESLLVDRPWHRGRTVVIGDAAHACPPTLAQGAAMCLEDASVLAELLLGRDRLDDGLWEEFMDRRYGRVAMVVRNSLQLTRWLLERSPDADVPGLMHATMSALAEPA